MAKGLLIGVLALQGAFKKHVQVLEDLGAIAVEVRKPQELVQCDALIIPGGESTTMMKQIGFIGLAEPIREFALHKPVFGTCAGLILMSSTVLDATFDPFALLDITVERNAYGSQVDSFQADVEVSFNRGKSSILPATFIRAPRIRTCQPKVDVLATYLNEPVIVQQGKHLGTTFHPELTSDTSIHAYFLEMV